MLAISLGLKLRADVLLPGDDIAAAYGAIADNFARAGYVTQVELNPRQRMTAYKGACSVVVKLIDPHGTIARDAELKLESEGRVVYGRGGDWYAQRPRVAPLLDYFFKRELARQRLPAARDPVWIVAIGPACPGRPDPALTDVAVRLVPAS